MKKFIIPSRKNGKMFQTFLLIMQELIENDPKNAHAYRLMVDQYQSIMHMYKE